MIKFLKKYKYTSLVVGALAIAMVGSVAWSFVGASKSKETNMNDQVFQETMQEVANNLEELCRKGVVISRGDSS